MDRTVVERAREGDRDAFGQLAADAIDRLYRVAYRILRDPDQARDATQQALLEAWRDLRSLRDPERWDAWTYRLLVNACYRERRSHRRIEGTVHLLPSDPGVTPDVAAAVADRDELDRSFDRLPMDQRAVVVLHHYLGLPLVEVAETLGIPAGTARSRLHTALGRMRAAIEEDSAEFAGNDRPARKGHAV